MNLEKIINDINKFYLPANNHCRKSPSEELEELREIEEDDLKEETTEE